MLDANYLRHLKPLGKMAYNYDSAASSEGTLNTGLARLWDQTATGEAASLPATTILAQFNAQIESAIASGPTALMAQMVSLCTAYITSEDFRGDLVDNTPENANDASSVLDAFALEMTGDGKSFDVAGSTGFVNFFTAVGTAMAETFPTDVSPTYADATYCIATIV